MGGRGWRIPVSAGALGYEQRGGYEVACGKGRRGAAVFRFVRDAVNGRTTCAAFRDAAAIQCRQMKGEAGGQGGLLVLLFVWWVSPKIGWFCWTSIRCTLNLTDHVFLDFKRQKR